MKIGITCYPTYGGSGAVATELGLELARRGHEVHFSSYASPFRLRGYAERVTFHEVTQTEYPLFEQSSPYALALAVKQHEVAMRENLDLMHVHYAIPHAATAWLAKQMLKSLRDLKIVTTLHGTDITLVGRIRRTTHSPSSQSNNRTASPRCRRSCGMRPTARSDAPAATSSSYRTSSRRPSTTRPARAAAAIRSRRPTTRSWSTFRISDP